MGFLSKYKICRVCGIIIRDDIYYQLFINGFKTCVCVDCMAHYNLADLKGKVKALIKKNIL